MAKPLSQIDKLRDSIEAQRAAVKDELREYLSCMDPYKFEELVLRLLERMRFTECRVTQRSKDGGIDLTASFSIGIGRIKTVGQVKRRRGAISTPVLQSFYGAMTGQKARGEVHLGLFITTSRFTADAQRWVEDSALPIVLIDGEKLAELLVEQELLVKVVPLPPALQLAVTKEHGVEPQDTGTQRSKRGSKPLFRWDLEIDDHGDFVLTGRYLADPTKSFTVRGRKVPPDGDYLAARAELHAKLVDHMRPLFPDLDEPHLNARAWSGTHKVYPAEKYASRSEGHADMV
ncbi:MAG: restriction endonuclease [Armatimonadetes bacterium]|nr:restriction endonuclease [Armatimonadota bacterium]